LNFREIKNLFISNERREEEEEEEEGIKRMKNDYISMIMKTHFRKRCCCHIPREFCGTKSEKARRRKKRHIF
jgi:hypothetical protein